MYSHRLLAALIVHLSMFLSAGCSSNKYQIEMSLDEDGLHRSVSGWQERHENDRTIIESLPDNEIWTLGAHYGHEGTTDNEGRNTFTGTFQNEIPDDVGGVGNVVTWSTSLGTMTAYSERIRGSDDLAGRWEERVRKIDRFCELIGGWAEEEAIDAEQGADIRQFVNGPLRDDLKNVSMLCWTLAAGGPLMSEKNLLEEAAMRLIQYGVEHGYVAPESIPQLMLVGRGNNQESLNVVLDVLDHKRGEQEPPLREVIPALQSVEAFQASLANYLANTPEADTLRRQADEGETVNVAGIPTDLLLSSLDSGLIIFAADDVAIGFVTGHEPFTTNGFWDPESGSVTWNRSVEGRGESPICVLPAQCFAIWTEPDVQFQEAHFGRVIFDGERLATYITWHEGLTAEKSKEWETFIEGLTPSSDLRAVFDRFRFEGEPSDTEDVALLSDIPRQLLQAALDAAD